MCLVLKFHANSADRDVEAVCADLGIRFLTWETSNTQIGQCKSFLFVTQF